MLPTFLCPPWLNPKSLPGFLNCCQSPPKWSIQGNFTPKVALLEQHFQCPSSASCACTVVSPVKNILGGAYTFEDPLIKRATRVVRSINDPPMATDRRDTKYLEFRATSWALIIDMELTDNPTSCVMVKCLPIDKEMEFVTKNLQTKEEWPNALLVMKNILWMTAAPLELLNYNNYRMDG